MIFTSPIKSEVPDCATATRSRLVVDVLRISHVLHPLKIICSQSSFRMKALCGQGSSGRAKAISAGSGVGRESEAERDGMHGELLRPFGSIADRLVLWSQWNKNKRALTRPRNTYVTGPPSATLCRV